MKSLVFLLSAVMVPGAALGQNLLTNPGFSTGVKGWTGTALVHQAGDGNSGSGCAEVSKDSLVRDPLIGQCVDISAQPAGAKYVFGGWIKAVNYDPQTNNTQPVAQLSYFSDKVCDSGNLIGESGGAQGWPTHILGSWQRYSAAGQAPAGTMSVLLQVGMHLAPNLPTSITRIDDAFLQTEDPPAGLVHLWPFNGNTRDVIGGADGVVVGSPSYVPAVFGSGLVFNGIDERVEADVDINPSTLATMTMGAWVIPENVTLFRTVISNDNGDYDRTLTLDDRGTGGTGWSAFVGTGVMGGGQAAHLNQPEFIAVLYDQNINSALLYVNGTVESGVTSMGSGLISIAIAANPTFHDHFMGIVDEVFIFDRVLTVEELDFVREFGAGSNLFADGFESGDTSQWSSTAP